MSNNELLLAISNMMDKKLKAELQPIRDELKNLREDVQILKRDVQVLKRDVQVLKRDVQVLKEEVQVLKEEVQVLKEEVQVLKEEVQILKEEVAMSKEEVALLKRNFHKMQLIQETQILPRLNTIESCYTDTYHRYRKDADKIESVYEDTQLLKKVVAEHSQKFQKLA